MVLVPIQGHPVADDQSVGLNLDNPDSGRPSRLASKLLKHSFRFVWRAFSEIHCAVLCKVLNICNSLLKRWRPFLHAFLEPRRFAFRHSDRVIAVERVACQHKNRDWISFVEPKQNRAFKLSDCGLIFVYNKDARTRIGLRLSAWLSAHDTSLRSTRYILPFVVIIHVVGISALSSSVHIATPPRLIT